MSSIKTKSYTQIRFMNTMAVALLLPFGGGLLAVAVTLLFVNWIIEGRFKYKLSSIQYPKLAFTFIAVYLMHVLGLLYSTNMSFGIADIGIKLSLFILPIVFLMNRDFDAEKMRRILYAFIIGCATSFCFCLIHALMNSSTGMGELSYEKLSFFIHPGYFSMYLSFAICIVLFLLQKNYFNTKIELVGWLLLVMGLFIAQLMLASKTGIIVTLLIFLFTGAYYATRSGKMLMGISIIVLLALFVSFGINKMPLVRERLKSLNQLTNIQSIDKTSSESSAVRILIWQAASTVIKDNYLIGVGTGDVKDALMEEYKKRGMTGAYEHELNAHNQFIQFFVAFGIVGLVLFTISIIVPFVYSIRRQKYLYAFFLAIFTFNLFTESALETQAGVIFYAFFNSLLLSTDRTFWEKSPTDQLL